MTIKDTMMPVISSYHGATTFGQTSPGNASRPYQTAASPGPSGQDVYNQSPEQSYVQATSPQPSGFQALAINRVSLYFAAANCVATRPTFKDYLTCEAQLII